MNTKRNHNTLSGIITGISDGLTVPLVLAAGLSAVVQNTGTIIQVVLAQIAVSSVAMGLGAYMTGKSEIKGNENEQRKTNQIAGNAANPKKEEVKQFFDRLGLTEELQDEAAAEVLKDKEEWTKLITTYERDAPKPDIQKAAKFGWIIGLSYVAGGLISLCPYFFTDRPVTALKYAAAFAVGSLFIFGCLQSKINDLPVWSNALRIAVTGALAAAAAFWVASLFMG